MKTLWRYYAARFLWAFFASLFILALLVLAVDTLLHLGEVLADGATPGDAALLMIERSAADYLGYLLPAAAFCGTFLAVSSAARAQEVMALRAGGISPLRAFAPILLLSLGVAGAALWLGETLGVRAAARLAEREGLGVDRLVLRSGAVWYHAGRLIYRGHGGDAEGGRLRDALLLERGENGRLLRSIHAATATRLDAERWLLEDAVLRRFNPKFPEAPPTLRREARLELRLPATRETGLDPRELAALPLATLRNYAARHGASGGGVARAVLHARLSAPAAAPIFALFALSLALAVERTRSSAMPALQGIAILLAFLMLREYGGGIALRIEALAVALPWLLVLLFFSWGALRLARAPR
ncbi:MAG: LptF/LptG family permease [Deltaproteobacteria bacterium]|nr:LptF/LptG family permease [Deltaproteobacteria bacterium]